MPVCSCAADIAETTNTTNANADTEPDGSSLLDEARTAANRRQWNLAIEVRSAPLPVVLLLLR